MLWLNVRPIEHSLMPAIRVRNSNQVSGPLYGRVYVVLAEESVEAGYLGKRREKVFIAFQVR